MGIIWMLLIGLCAGWLAGQLMKSGDFGLVGDLIVGVVGSFLGGLLIGVLGFAPTHLLGQLISATFGAVVLIALLRWWGRRT